MRLADAVYTLIDRSSFLSEALYNDLINQSSLARMIKADIDHMTGKENSILAISKAISRCSISDISVLEKSENQVVSSITDILVRSELVDMTFTNSRTLLKAQSAILKEVEDDSRIFLSLMRGIYETTIVCSESLFKKVKQEFSREKQLSERHDLAAISVLFSANNVETRGLYYHLFKKLAWHGVNVIEVLSTSNELSLVFNKQDMQHVFSLFINLKTEKNLGS